MESALMLTSLSWIDLTIVIITIGLTAWAGCFFARWIKAPDDFYVAGRELSPFIIAAALAATNISLYNFQSYVGYAYREGISIVWHEWTGLMVLAFAGTIVLPLFRRLRIATIPEFLGRRYGPSLRVLVALLWSLRFAVTLGGLLYLAAQIACVVGGFRDTGPAYHAFIFLFGFVTIAITVAGGSWAVALTDVIQFTLLLGGGLIMIPLIMHTVGYWHGMQQTLSQMGREDALCFVPKDGFWNWKGALGIWLLGTQWACTDQGMLQRVFGARSVKAAVQGMVLGGMISIPLAFIIPMPGIAAAIKVSQGTMPAVLRQDNILPMWLASGIVPVGLLGIILSGLVASEKSSIGGYLSSTSTLITMDVIGVFSKGKKTQLSDRQTILVLRALTILVGIVMIATSYLAKASQSAIDLYIGMISVVDLPLFVVAILYGFAWKRATPAGAIAGYSVGMVLGLVVQLRSCLGPGAEAFVDGIYWLYSYVPILGEGVTAANANRWDTAVIGMVVTGIAVPLMSMFTKQSHPDRVDEVWNARKVSEEERSQGEAFYIWPASVKGRTYFCLMFVGLAVFLVSLVLGKYPAQEGYGIGRIEMQRFEQTALLVPARDLPPGVTAESRRALLDDLTTLAKNRDPTDRRRKPLADSLVPRMKDLMRRYCQLAESLPQKYGEDYLSEFQEQMQSIQAGPGRVIRESRIAGPLAITSMLFCCILALMRLRYD